MTERNRITESLRKGLHAIGCIREDYEDLSDLIVHIKDIKNRSFLLYRYFSEQWSKEVEIFNSTKEETVTSYHVCRTEQFERILKYGKTIFVENSDFKRNLSR